MGGKKKKKKNYFLNQKMSKWEDKRDSAWTDESLREFRSGEV